MSKIGNMLYEFRLKGDLTVKELLKELYCGGGGVSPSYITKIELHGEIPSAVFIIALADVMGISRADLLDIAKKEKLAWYKKKIDKEYLGAITMLGHASKRTTQG